MPKVIKYSELDNKLKKILHLSITKFDTIYLDNPHYYIENDKYIKNLNTIIISKNMIENVYDNLKILLPYVKDIYVEGYDNLGGITIPYNVIKKDFKLFIKFEENTEIKKLNILNDKNSIIKLDKDIEYLEIFKVYKDEVIIYIKYKKRKLKYTIDNLGNINEVKDTYIIDDSDIKDGTLDLTNLTEYVKLSFPRKNINTLIINKHYIEFPNKLYFLSSSRKYTPFHDYMNFNKLRIVDDNNMKLLPIDKTFDISSNKKIYFISDGNKYIYIKNEKEDNNTLIYVDKNNNIKILERKEMLTNPDIIEVIINYRDSELIHNSSPRLILIKYKDYYIIKDFDKEYKLDNSFFKLLSVSAEQFFCSNKLIEALKNNDLITIFNSNEFYYKLFYEMYNEYLKYKNYIDRLISLGFTNDAIEYLFDRKFNTIINPDENILSEIENIEIKHFNEIGEYYIKKKRKKYE